MLFNLKALEFVLLFPSISSITVVVHFFVDVSDTEAPHRRRLRSNFPESGPSELFVGSLERMR